MTIITIFVFKNRDFRVCQHIGFVFKHNLGEVSTSKITRDSRKSRFDLIQKIQVTTVCGGRGPHHVGRTFNFEQRILCLQSTSARFERSQHRGFFSQVCFDPFRRRSIKAKKQGVITERRTIRNAIRVGHKILVDHNTLNESLGTKEIVQLRLKRQLIESVDGGGSFECRNLVVRAKVHNGRQTSLLFARRVDRRVSFLSDERREQNQGAETEENIFHEPWFSPVQRETNGAARLREILVLSC